MRIDSYMDVNQLMERMGTEATIKEATYLKSILVAEMRDDTSDYTESEWLDACETAMRFA